MICCCGCLHSPGTSSVLSRPHIHWGSHSPHSPTSAPAPPRSWDCCGIWQALHVGQRRSPHHHSMSSLGNQLSTPVPELQDVWATCSGTGVGAMWRCWTVVAKHLLLSKLTSLRHSTEQSRTWRGGVCLWMAGGAGRVMRGGESWPGAGRVRRWDRLSGKCQALSHGRWRPAPGVWIELQFASTSGMCGRHVTI